MSKARDIADRGSSIDSSEITDGAVTSSKLASGAAATNIGTGGVTSSMLAEGAVEGAMVTPSGRRNLIINGAFNVSQRGDYSSATSSSDNTYYLDRWNNVVSGVTGTVQQVDNTSYYSMKCAATSTASGTLGSLQKLEEFHKGKTLVASVNVKSNNSNARVLLYDGVSFFGTSSAHTGGGSVEQLIATGTVSTSATLLRVYVIIGTAAAGAVSITSGDYIEMHEVQLEVGSVATPFEHRSYGEELALCQRYYQRFDSTSSGNAVFGYGHALSATACRYVFTPDTELRSTPTFSISNVSACTPGGTRYNATSSGLSTSSGGTVDFNLYVASGLTANNPYFVRAQTSLDGYIAFDAEL